MKLSLFFLTFFLICVVCNDVNAASRSEKNDIIIEALYGTPDDVRHILSVNKEQLMHYNVKHHGEINLINIAFYYAVICNRFDTSEILLKNGAYIEDGFKSYNGIQCPKKLTTTKVVSAKIKSDNEEIAEGEYECIDPLIDMIKTPRQIEFLLKNDRNYCKRDVCLYGNIKGYIDNMKQNEDKNYILFKKIYNRYCK